VASPAKRRDFFGKRRIHDQVRADRWLAKAAEFQFDLMTLLIGM
jgi:hypothetical protein